MMTPGIWTAAEHKTLHRTSPDLAWALVEFFSRDLPVYDLGCGLGYYVKAMREGGHRAIGVEGHGDAHWLSCTSAMFIHDLTEPMGWPPAQVLCLEVGEHIPPALTSRFIDNLDRLTLDHLVLSWAVPGQTGHGHVNELTNGEVAALLDPRGLVLDEAATVKMRSLPFREAGKPGRLTYFERSLMVFRRAVPVPARRKAPVRVLEARAALAVA